VRISRQAYAKVFLHAAKYFDCPLLGYIIGREVGDTVEVLDVLPVCHSNPAGPVLELAGDVADHAFSGSGKVLGIYFACERLNNESSPAAWVDRVRDGVAAVTGDCLVLQVKGKLLASKDRLFLECAGSPVQLLEPLSVVAALLDALLSDKQHHVLVDLQTHMDSTPAPAHGSGSCSAADFRNVALNGAIQQFKVAAK